MPMLIFRNVAYAPILLRRNSNDDARIFNPAPRNGRNLYNPELLSGFAMR